MSQFIAGNHSVKAVAKHRYASERRTVEREDDTTDLASTGNREANIGQACSCGCSRVQRVLSALTVLPRPARLL